MFWERGRIDLVAELEPCQKGRGSVE